MTLTVGANTFTAPTTHTATGGAYNINGCMTVTINNHGFSAGDKVKFDVGVWGLVVLMVGTTAYPRSTDPIANKWITIANVTTNTFDVLVLDTIPSTNTSPHTYQVLLLMPLVTTSTVKISRNYS